MISQSRRSVKDYHADNGRFADNGFVDAINSKSQKLDFCGVEAHRQNSITEKQNKVLTTCTRTLLIHGIRMWPQMIKDMFWPFAMKNSAKRLKNLQVDILGRIQKSIFHGVEVHDTPVKSYHTLFCPTYVIDVRLQSPRGTVPPKWEPRSQIGVYLGHLPFHVVSVRLVWNPTTGRVRT